MPSWCRQVNWGNCGIPWVKWAVLCVKDNWKGQFWGLRYYLPKLRSLLIFFRQVWRHTVTSLSLTESVQSALTWRSQIMKPLNILFFFTSMPLRLLRVIHSRDILWSTYKPALRLVAILSDGCLCWVDTTVPAKRYVHVLHEHEPHDLINDDVGSRSACNMSAIFRPTHTTNINASEAAVQWLSSWRSQLQVSASWATILSVRYILSGLPSNRWGGGPN
jgi:hypothetical protein